MVTLMYPIVFIGIFDWVSVHVGQVAHEIASVAAGGGGGGATPGGISERALSVALSADVVKARVTAPVASAVTVVVLSSAANSPTSLKMSTFVIQGAALA